MVGLVHLVQRFTVPFASHTRARIIRCESPPLCPHHWSFLTAYPTLYKFHLRLRFPTDRISESASAKWKRRQWRDPIGLEFLLLFVGEAKRKSSAHDSGLLSFATFSSWVYTLYITRVCVRQRERWTSVPSVPTSDGISAWSFLLRRTVRPDGWRYLYAPRCVRFSARCWITFRLPADYTLMKGYVMEFTGSTEAEII